MQKKGQTQRMFTLFFNKMQKFGILGFANEHKLFNCTLHVHLNSNTLRSSSFTPSPGLSARNATLALSDTVKVSPPKLHPQGACAKWCL